MPDRTDVERIVIQSTANVCKVEPETLSMQTRFAEDLKLRSMQAIKITVLLEDQFDVKMPMARVLKSQTLGDTADLVEELLAAR